MATREPGGPQSGQLEPIPDEWKLSPAEKKVLFSVAPDGLDEFGCLPNMDFSVELHRTWLAEKYLAQFTPQSQISLDSYAKQAATAASSKEHLAKMPAKMVDIRSRHPEFGISSGRHYSLPAFDFAYASPFAEQMRRTIDEINEWENSDELRNNHPYTLVVDNAKYAAQQGQADEREVAIALAVLDAGYAQAQNSGMQGGGMGFEWHLENAMQKAGLEFDKQLTHEELLTYLDNHCLSYEVPE